MIRSMNLRGAVLVSFAVAAMASMTPAQGTKKFVDEKAGFEMRIPRWLEPVPTKPGDEQTLIQLKGSSDSNVKWMRGPAELTLLICRISKREGPVTGEEGAEEQEEKPTSLTDSRTDALNGGRTVPEYLERRGYRSDLEENTGYFRRPVEDERGREYGVFEFSVLWNEFTSPPGEKIVLVRAFVVEDEAEILAMIALGQGASAFEKDVERALRSLTRVGGVAAEGGDADPYEGSELRDVDRRRDVRAELVEGWEAHDTENFILVTNVTKKKVVEECLTDLEILRKEFLARFPPAEGADMSAVSTVRLCDGYDDYLRYAGQDKDGTGGYWAFLDEELVLFNPERRVPKLRPWLKDIDPISILYHEAMHQYFHYSNRQLAPGSWFGEGYGEVFGGADVDRRKGVIKKFKTNKFRMKLIRAERKRSGTPDLRMMLIMPQHEFYADGVLVNYANAWAFCYFLELERLKPERKRNQAWADFPDVYLKNLREITERYRERFPEDAPADWIIGFADEIQREAIDAALKTVDARELEEAWTKAMTKWR